MTSNITPHKKDFGPFPADIYSTPSAYCCRCPLHPTCPTCDVKCAELPREGFPSHFQADSMACALVERVQGECGFVVPPPEHHARLKASSAEHGIVFAAEQVQDRHGSWTGKSFAMDHYPVEPDTMATAKALGAEFLIAGITGKADIVNAAGAGAIGGTFGGNPLSCEVSLTVFAMMDETLAPLLQDSTQTKTPTS